MALIYAIAKYFLTMFLVIHKIIIMKNGMSKNMNRYEQGVQKFKEMKGKDSELVIQRLMSLHPDLARYAMEFAFGDIYNRPLLDIKSREIATIAALIALGNSVKQLKVHIHCALNSGVKREEIIEIILQMAVYAGFAAAINAMQASKEVFDEIDNEKSKVENGNPSKIQQNRALSA